MKTPREQRKTVKKSPDPYIWVLIIVGMSILFIALVGSR